MSTTLIGRKKELAILNAALESPKAEMISIIGRRRVGKTFLVKKAFENHLNFQFTGIQNASNIEQLQNFSFSISLASGSAEKIKTPSNWVEAFMQLIQFLKSQQKGEKQVVFIDELPWLDNRKSGFLRGLSFFWNTWAVDQKIVVIICGSAASWMIEKVVHHKGGLHNRITQNIYLQPFTLKETEAFLKHYCISLNRFQIAQLYMAIGGIPHYLEKVKPGKSAAQIIDELCFSENGFLRDEFSKLYPALFENAEQHIRIIRTLATKKLGMTRAELIDKGRFNNGGTFSKMLLELIQSGFISVYHPYGKKKKQKTYRLTDEYSLFYLQFIEQNSQEGRLTWQLLSQTQAYKIWSGYAFENLCIKHLPQLKKALDIGGVHTVSSSFLKKGNSIEKGTQIDLVLERKDGVTHLFEMKFYNKNFSLDKAYAKVLMEKRNVFEAQTKTKDQLFWTLVTTFGMEPNQHSIGLIEQVLCLDDLFVE